MTIQEEFGRVRVSVRLALARHHFSAPELLASRDPSVKRRGFCLLRTWQTRRGGWIYPPELYW